MLIVNIIEGIIIGIMVSAPLGPVGIICIQRTLNKGRVAGYISGLGAVVGDILYAIFAGFGITVITNFLIDQQVYLRVFGGALLVFVGIRMFFTDTVKQVKEQRLKKKQNVLSDFISVFFLTISNPMTIVAFGILIASLGFSSKETGFFSMLYLILGIMLGAMLWWFVLVTLVNLFRDRFKLKRLIWINKITAIGVVLFGLFAGISVFFN